MHMIGGAGRRIPGAVPLSRRKDRDDQDLLLFKELHIREKDMIASLLQPVSDEFEFSAGGNHALYRIASGKKGSGHEFFGENDKNDYDWLKTPPATPLFPSLEMEANHSELVVQREIPIIQPLSRFAGNSEPLKRSTTPSKRPKFPINTKPKTPQRSVTPSQRPIIKLIQNDTISTKSTPSVSQKIVQSTIINPEKGPNATAKTTSHFQQRDSQTKFLTANNNNVGFSSDTKPKPKSRGVSPFVRSTISTQISGFSDETPPNLRTNIRATSATRGRPASGTLTSLPPPVVLLHKKPEPTVTPSAERMRRQSCSPSVTRGRKEISGDANYPTTHQKRKNKSTRNGITQVLGSRMVDKIISARKISSGGEEKEVKAKLQGGGGATGSAASFGKTLSKISLDPTTMEMKQDRISSGYYNIFPTGGRSSSSVT